MSRAMKTATERRSMRPFLGAEPRRLLVRMYPRGRNLKTRMRIHEADDESVSLTMRYVPPAIMTRAMTYLSVILS